MKDKNGNEVIIGYTCIIDIKKGELVERKLGQVTGVIQEKETELATVLVLDEKVGMVYEIKAENEQIEMK